jgi:hypothetical protein
MKQVIKRIILNWAVGVTIISIANLSVAKQDSSLDLTINTGKNEYVLPLEWDVSEQLDSKFLEVRKMILTKLAHALDMGEIAFGSIEWIREKWVVSKIKRENMKKIDLIKLASDDLKPIIMQMTEEDINRELQMVEDLMQRNLKTRSKDIIYAILRRVDQTLAKQKNVVAHANEFGLMASIGAQFILGSNQKGVGGLLSIGLSIGFNKQTGAFYLDIFRSVEKFESTLMKVAFTAGLATKAGIEVRGDKASESSLISKTFYPPVIPGYSNWSEASFSSGFSSGLTLPPSPIGDLITYQTSTKTESILKIQISKVFPAWIRVTSPLISDKTQVVKDYIGRLWKVTNADKCSMVLSPIQ